MVNLQAVDWWSVGVLTYELLTGASPFTVDGEKNTQQDISRRILKTEPPMPSHMGPTVRDFILRLLVKDPRQRLGGGPGDAKELKEHTFFKEAPPPFSWEALERREITPPFVPTITHELDTSNFSDEFTKMIATDSPAVVPPNYDKIFRGYSYVAPSIPVGDNVASKDIIEEVTIASTESEVASVSDELAVIFEESPFLQAYELDPQEEALGDGSYSVCHKCRHKETLEEYAVKIVSRTVDCGGEVNLLRTCQGHPNIVKLIDVLEDKTHMYLVMELLSGGELLRRPRPFSEQQASKIMRQLASAVLFMHSKGVVHRDLKPENIVFAHESEDSPVKIVDFGFARIKRGCEPLHTPCFTLPYAAPEVIAEQGYDQSCDLWSLGAILYSLLSRDPPFGTDSPDLATRIRAGEIDFDSESWSHVSDLTKQVVKGLLTVDPSKRLTASGLVNHPWLNESSSFEVSASVDQTTTDNLNTLSEKPEGFRLREVDGARLAQRRKLHKRSTSSSVSSSASTTSSSQSVQPVQPPSTATNLTTSVSPAQPSAFDFGEDKVNEYLSSLSSSSDSNSPRTVQQESSKKRKRDEDGVTTSRRLVRYARYIHDYYNSTGPVTRSKKRKLEEQTVNEDDLSTTESCETNQVDFREIRRKQKTGKRPKGLTTVITE